MKCVDSIQVPVFKDPPWQNLSPSRSMMVLTDHLGSHGLRLQFRSNDYLLLVQKHPIITLTAEHIRELTT